MKRKRILPLIIVIGLLTMLELLGGYWLCRANLWFRFIKVVSWQSTHGRPLKSPAYYQNRVSKQPWYHLRDPMQKSLAALKWTMNRCRKVGTNQIIHDDPEALLKSVESGEGALCGDMADLYINVLAASKLPARRVLLYRNLFDIYDAHVTIEVLINNQWVIIDPTFGVSYTNSKEELLSAQNVKEYLLQGLFQEVKPVFHGEVRYPPRLEKYYINYWILYNNVFVEERAPNGLLRYLPPFCYFWGSRLYYQKASSESDFHILTIQSLYFVFTIIVPAIIIILSILTLIIHDIFIPAATGVGPSAAVKTPGLRR
jgi:hypothetical protein